MSKPLRPRRLCVAPMVGVTNLYHRYLCRLLSEHITLYTEMLVAETVTFGKPELVRAMMDAGADGPVVLQLAGRDPATLQIAAQLAQTAGGFTEININCGCPSKRAAVGGEFGAQMMKEPLLVAEIVSTIKQVCQLPVTIKMRLGVDDLDSYDYVQQFNRSIPPLKYNWVRKLCEDFPQVEFELNGGVDTLQQALIRSIENPALAGVMMGRAVWRDPLLLCQVDSEWFQQVERRLTRRQVLQQYVAKFDRTFATPLELAEPLEALQGLLYNTRGAAAFRRAIHAKRQAGCCSLGEILQFAMLAVPEQEVWDQDICQERRRQEAMVEEA
ncbi:hypothetical protein BASA81_007105 [Batrachochytrium salamandrivorans]|nr:hypothetical protein BASA81_007105 [Batrachochytrium salamandrivorans]